MKELQEYKNIYKLQFNKITTIKNLILNNLNIFIDSCEKINSKWMYFIINKLIKEKKENELFQKA